MTALWVAMGINFLVLILIALLVAGILRHLQSLQMRLEESIPHITRFEAGEPVTSFTLADLAGRDISSDGLIGNGQPSVLLLLTASCAECDAIVNQLVELTTRPGGMGSIGWNVVTVWYGEPDAVESKAAALSEAGIPVLVDRQASLSRGYLVSSLPVGMAIDGKGRLTSQSANPGPSWLYRSLAVEAPTKPLQATWRTEISFKA